MKWITAFFLVTLLLSIGRCAYWCKSDVQYKMAELGKFGDEDLSASVDLLLSMKPKDASKRFMITKQEIPSKFAFIDASYVLVDDQGYAVFYIYSPLAWRGVVIKRSNISFSDMKLPRGDYSGNAAYYVGHHVP